MGTRPVYQTALLYFAVGCTAVLGHGHHDKDINSPENLAKPIDSIMWLHIIIQIVAWGFMFPIGMILGMSKSRWHVPTQVTGLALTTAGYFMGHKHGGRKFPHTVHGSLANFLIWAMVAQGLLGVYLKLHIHEKSIRPYAAIAHGVLGKTWPVLGWTQLLFGAMTLRGYCMGDHVGQCAAHYIMGSAFIGYGILLALVIYGGAQWVRRTGRSQEWFDSLVILIWGIVNTFTEHHGSLTSWSHKDLQHTMLGVLWWTGGALGVYVSRGGRRSLVPAIIIIMTGWAMSAHEQALMISTKVHSMFGIVLMAAGLARLIEIALILNFMSEDDADANINDNVGSLPIRTFQHLPPFLLVAAGVLFMGGTDEELEYVNSLEIDHVTYILMMFSLAFVIYLYAVFLINLVSTTGLNASEAPELSSSPSSTPRRKPLANGYSQVPHRPNGSIDVNGRPVLRDEEVFEMGEYDEDERTLKDVDVEEGITRNQLR